MRKIIIEKDIFIKFLDKFPPFIKAFLKKIKKGRKLPFNKMFIIVWRRQ
jgi:hypothetical protein